MAVMPSARETRRLCEKARELVHEPRTLIDEVQSTCDSARLTRVRARELRGPRCPSCRQFLAESDEIQAIQWFPAGWHVSEETVTVHSHCVAVWIVERVRRVKILRRAERRPSIPGPWESRQIGWI
jgi:hypothetical protein